ncbi:hypothetical protein J6590_010436 [Homalodisca vitripennis]|nr:hypothetical protein J6590_010436 [Homalodisca vitripennis]
MFSESKKHIIQAPQGRQGLKSTPVVTVPLWLVVPPIILFYGDGCENTLPVLERASAAVLPRADVNERKSSLKIVSISKILNSRGQTLVRCKTPCSYKKRFNFRSSLETMKLINVFSHPSHEKGLSEEPLAITVLSQLAFRKPLLLRGLRTSLSLGNL